MKNTAPLLLVLLSLVGIGLGQVLTDIHFQLSYQPALEFDSACEISETISCAAVNTSKYGKISLGHDRPPLPISIPALGFFALILLLGAAAARADENRRRPILALAALLLLPALAVSGLLLAIQMFILKAYCLYCLGLDAAVLLSLIVAVAGHGGGARGLLDDLPKAPRGLAVSGLVAMLLVNWGAYVQYASKAAEAENGQLRLAGKDHGAHTSEDHDEAAHGGESAASADPHAGHSHGPGGHKEGGTSTTDPHGQMDEAEKAKMVAEAKTAIIEFLATYPTLTALDLPINPFDAIKGRPDSPLTVVEFADFQCPHCRLAGFFLKDIVHRYGDKALFVFKNFPFGKACNDRVSRDIHPFACDAAIAVQCGRRQGRFWDFHDLVFDAQQDLEASTFGTVADTLGLDRARFDACLENPAVLQEVKTQIDQGRAVGLEGTPTFYVNGKKLGSSHPLFVEAALRYELVQAGETQLPEDPDGIFGD